VDDPRRDAARRRPRFSGGASAGAGSAATEAGQVTLVVLAILLSAAPATAILDIPDDARERLAVMLAGEAPHTIERLDAGEIAVRFPSPREGPGPHSNGVLRLHSRDTPLVRFRTRSFAVGIDGASEPHLAPLVHAAHAIRERDDGVFASTGPVEGADRVLSTYWRALGLGAILALALACWRRFNIGIDVRGSHLLPAAIQTTVFAYWSLYWQGVTQFAPQILLQVAFAYTLEAGLSFARFGYWRVGLGPWPIVLSANLFAWFEPKGALALVAAAVGSKVLLRRNGRHIFNPSAFGLSVAGLLFTFGGLFQRMNAAPNISELVVLLALLPQARFPIALVSVGALIGLAEAGNWSNVVDVVRAPTLLAIALLVTDPATIPRTPFGRLLFGVLYGLGTGVFVVLLGVFHQPDDLGKVLAIPVANLLVPWLDRIGARLDLSVLSPKWNLAHVMLWLVLITQDVVAAKAHNFLAAHHWTFGTPLVRYGMDDVPRCSDNEVFCRPFSMIEEVRLWIRAEP
jgi:hypothetical protein